MKAVFISDIHLQNSEEPNAQLLVDLLERLQSNGTTHLYLLGDIFDLWIANHAYFCEKFGAVIDQLHRLRRAGVEIHYFEGNHDLDLKPLFEKHVGCTVHEKVFITTIANQKVRIEHGDQMDPEDRDYLFLRWFLRTPVMRFLGRHLPGAVVRWIGETASRKSRNYTTGVRQSIGKENVERKLIAHAERAMRKDGFNFLIAGHVHVPFDRTLEFGARRARVINLGTWLDEPILFELDQTEARVHIVEDYLTRTAPSNSTLEQPLS